ncbi:Rne/Rng family ribonuclease [Porphyromonas macacae]|uniref:Ribonuclease G n=1 Tax=Porphyromonas macacae TaxID=28115 RepID=A0A379DH73_9PORP|nr:Rne/Rng family ribonuclease [Porphyromonas macacae]SUB77738.1 Ribonuclease G [Porphyromonas macacae]
MDSELIVDVKPNEVSMAMLEDQKLVELQREQRDSAFAVGDIYLGKVKKVMPGLNAAFVDVGYKKDAFLHYLDLGPTFGLQKRLMEMVATQKQIPSMNKIKAENLELPKDGKIGDVLKAGDILMVQIVKEPISTKGPRLTTDISLAGRNMVLVPMADKVSISQKIQSTEERERLRQLILSIKPKFFSFIIRTSAQGKRASELDKEMHRLVRRWEDLLSKLPKAKAPKLIYQEPSRALGLLRDTFNASYKSIHVNDKPFYEDIREYVEMIAPGREDIVQLYKGELPLFDQMGITKQIKALFGRTVTYKSGAYLIIEQTEAMHVVDVNSGNRSRNSSEQENTAVDVNMSAAEELARQLRLRDMGGIIVVDFIDMHEAQHRQQLYEHMVKLMANDRARHNILPLSKFGLMQITRQRVRPAMQINIEEKCPTCLGTGKIKSSILFTDRLEEIISHLVRVQKVTHFTMHVHPYVAAYLKKGLLNSIAKQWKSRYSKGLRVLPNESLSFLEYKIYDKEGNEVEIIDFEEGRRNYDD